MYKWWMAEKLFFLLSVIINIVIGSINIFNVQFKSSCIKNLKWQTWEMYTQSENCFLREQRKDIFYI